MIERFVLRLRELTHQLAEALEHQQLTQAHLGRARGVLAQLRQLEQEALRGAAQPLAERIRAQAALQDELEDLGERLQRLARHLHEVEVAP